MPFIHCDIKDVSVAKDLISLKQYMMKVNLNTVDDLLITVSMLIKQESVTPSWTLFLLWKRRFILRSGIAFLKFFMSFHVQHLCTFYVFIHYSLYPKKFADFNYTSLLFIIFTIYNLSSFFAINFLWIHLYYNVRFFVSYLVITVWYLVFLSYF